MCCSTKAKRRNHKTHKRHRTGCPVPLVPFVVPSPCYFASYCGGCAAPPRGGVPVNTFPSGSVTETKMPPGSPFLNGRAVNLILSPGLTVVDFQPARTKYDGGFISRFQTSVAPLSF